MEQKVLHFFINFLYNYLQLTNKYHEFLFLSITGMHKRKIESLHKTLVEDNLKSNLPFSPLKYRSWVKGADYLQGINLSRTT
jgi:hypothetical protein